MLRWFKLKNKLERISDESKDVVRDAEIRQHREDRDRARRERDLAQSKLAWYEEMVALGHITVHTRGPMYKVRDIGDDYTYHRFAVVKLAPDKTLVTLSCHSSEAEAMSLVEELNRERN